MDKEKKYSIQCLVPKQPEESVFGKAAPQNFDSERATIAGGKARVRIKILR